MQRSKATYPVFVDEITQDEFLLLVTLVALQQRQQALGADTEEDPTVALQWLLAYWRANAADTSKHDRAELFFYGRVGYSDLSLEETQSEIIGLLTEGYYSSTPAMVPLADVNDFLRWAFESYIDWAPEPVMPTLSRKEYIQTVMDFSVALSQFTDHFEDFQVRRIMQYLMGSFHYESSVWYILSQSPSIDVEYEGFGITLIFSLGEKRVMNLHIDDWASFHVTMEN